jgi:cytochrome c oxidase cbb3-type subunit 2
MSLNFHKNHKLLFGIVFWGFIFLSLLIAVFPASWVQKRNQPLAASEPMSELERKGLNVFIGEGCGYCHTQQVRPIAMDANWGRPSAPGDYAQLGRQDLWRQTPAVLGSARIGPDLSNVAERQPSSVWHYMHLYNPRAVVQESIMPSYPWMFEIKEQPESDDIVISLPEEYAPDKGKVVATSEANALVAYLLSLKQVPMDNGPTAGSKSEPEQKQVTDQQLPNGSDLYTTHCAACHQSNGQGLPGAFPALADDPVVTDPDPTDHIRVVLYGLEGVPIAGTTYQGAMQPFQKILTDQEVAAIINHERTSWGNEATTVTAEEVKRVRSDEQLNRIESPK